MDNKNSIETMELLMNLKKTEYKYKLLVHYIKNEAKHSIYFDKDKLIEFIDMLEEKEEAEETKETKETKDE